MIVQYIHDKKKNKLRGVIVADKINNYPIISWSYTNFKAGDRFDKQRGLEIAISRFNTKTNAEVPRQILKLSENFKKRVARYFKVDIDSINLVGKGEKF